MPKFARYSILKIVSLYVILKPKGTEHLTPRKALFGLNIPLSLEIRKVILRFAGIFILKNHLSSVREKFQMGIFVPGKEHFRSHTWRITRECNEVRDENSL